MDHLGTVLLKLAPEKTGVLWGVLLIGGGSDPAARATNLLSLKEKSGKHHIKNKCTHFTLGKD